MEEAVQPAALQLSESARDFLAGAIGGACGVISGQPLDTVRIRQQQPGASRGGVARFVRSIVSAEGGAALFRGLGYPLATAAFQNAVVFQCYGAAARHLSATTSSSSSEGGSGSSSSSSSSGSSDPAPMPLSRVFLAGCFAGAVQTAIVTPVDLLKIRLQLQTAVRGAPGYVGPLSLLANLLRQEGLPGVYRGAAITFIRDFPSHGVYFAVYEAARELLEPGSRQAGSQSPAALWAAGGLAGAVSWLSVYPFDVVKTRLQAAAATQSPYTGWWDCARQSYAAEGSSVFFRGLNTTLGRAFLVNGAIFSAYEVAHKLLSQQQPQKQQQAEELLGH